ncbi:MAG: LPS export ABC transporter periplasmic protein LptC [Cytophagales bacterium]|nr:LPS export ABC transporter periplasmic protein LptC [Cytophagales bacterium]
MNREKIKRGVSTYLPFFILMGAFTESAAMVLEQYKGPIIEASKIETLSSDSAVVTTRMRAEKSLEYENGDREYPEGIYIEFYEGDSIASTLTANKAYYYSKEDLYKGEGNVEIKNYAKEEQLNTEELYLDPKEEKIFTDKFVRVETKGDILMGEGITASQDFSWYKISKPTGVINVKQIE